MASPFLYPGRPGRVAFDRVRLRPNTPNRGIAWPGVAKGRRRLVDRRGVPLEARGGCAASSEGRSPFGGGKAPPPEARKSTPRRPFSPSVIGEDCSKRRAPNLCVYSPSSARTACLRNSCRTAEVYLTGDAIMVYEGGEDPSGRFREYFHIFLCRRRGVGINGCPRSDISYPTCFVNASRDGYITKKKEKKEEIHDYDFFTFLDSEVRFKFTSGWY